MSTYANTGKTLRESRADAIREFKSKSSAAYLVEQVKKVGDQYEVHYHHMSHPGNNPDFDLLCVRDPNKGVVGVGRLRYYNGENGFDLDAYLNEK